MRHDHDPPKRTMSSPAPFALNQAPAASSSSTTPSASPIPGSSSTKSSGTSRHKHHASGSSTDCQTSRSRHNHRNTDHHGTKAADAHANGWLSSRTPRTSRTLDYHRGGKGASSDAASVGGRPRTASSARVRGPGSDGSGVASPVEGGPGRVRTIARAMTVETSIDWTHERTALVVSSSSFALPGDAPDAGGERGVIERRESERRRLRDAIVELSEGGGRSRRA